MIRRIRYYVSSIPTLVKGIRNWQTLLLLILHPVVIVLRAGYKFKVRSLMDVWVVKETCLDRDYERNCSQIEDGWVIVDVGAGLGDFAISVAKKHPHCQIYAFEPFPESFNLLRENLRLNGVSNVIASPAAIGAKSGHAFLATTGKAVQHTTTHPASSNENTVKVPMLSLRELFDSNNVEYCDLLKIDCEGCEFDALLNTPPEILTMVRRICLEYHDGFTQFSHVDLVDHLQQSGFRVKLASNPVHSYLGFLYAHRE